MVCYDDEISGSGLIDPFLETFTVNKYGNEHHARSLDKNHFYKAIHMSVLVLIYKFVKNYMMINH